MRIQAVSHFAVPRIISSKAGANPLVAANFYLAAASSAHDLATVHVTGLTVVEGVAPPVLDVSVRAGNHANRRIDLTVVVAYDCVDPE